MVLRRSLLPALILLTGSCGLFEKKPPPPVPPRKTAEGKRLRELVAMVARRLEESGRRIAESTSSLALKRESVYFRIRTIDVLKELALQDNPWLGGLDLWTYCIQLEHYLDEGAGKALFGPQQPIAVEAAKEVRSLLAGFALDKLPPEDYQKTSELVHRFAVANPITRGYGRLSLQISEDQAAKTSGVLSWIPSVSSLNPFAGVGEGISEGAAAIYAVGEVVDHFSGIVDLLPYRVGWQLELFQYDLAENEAIREATRGITRASTGVDAAVEVARGIPASVRSEVEKALESIDPKLTEVRGTLNDARATLGELDTASGSLTETGKAFDKAAASLESMARQLDTTLKTFNDTFVLLDGDPNAPKAAPDPDAPKPRPFDVLDFDQTARSVTAMAAELKQTLRQLQQLVTDERLTLQIGEVQTTTRTTIDGLIRTAAVSAVGVLAAFFVLLLGYRIVAGRLSRAAVNPRP